MNGVVLLGSDGRSPRRLPLLSAPLGSTTGAALSIAWAPNSRSLAINEADGHRLVIRGIDGRVRVIRRAGGTTVMGSMTWSPDGRWISYNRENRGGANGVGCCSASLHRIHPDGSGDHAVTVIHEYHDVPLRFSGLRTGADSRSLPMGATCAIPRSLSSRRLPADHRSSDADGGVASPNGSERAVFQLGLNGQPNSLSLIDASGQSRALATTLPPSGPGSWSPDGTKLVIACAQTSTENGFSTTGAVDLGIVDPTGGPAQVLTHLPSGSAVEFLAWRPTRYTANTAVQCAGPLAFYACLMLGSCGRCGCATSTRSSASRAFGSESGLLSPPSVIAGD